MMKLIEIKLLTWSILCIFFYSQNVLGEVPVAPSGLTATAVSLNQINLVWQDNAIDETSYEIQYFSGNSWVKLASAEANANTYHHTNLNPGVAFKYRVYATNTNGNSAFSNEVTGKTPASKGTRYETKSFTSSLTSNISYGPAATSVLDIYQPSGDNFSERPLVIFIHGGGFSGGDKVGSWNTLLCTNLAQRGYVVASINYRLTSTQNNLAQRYQAMIKAVQDAKATVRFFKKNAGTFKIDTSQIFATGSSAGSITALHLAYLEQSEVPAAYIPEWSLFDGSLEGYSGNPGYSSKIHGVISNWGAIGELDYIKSGDIPVFCVHGTADATISYNLSPAYHAMNFGSKPIVENALKKGIHAGLLLFPGVGHTLDSNTAYQNQAADAIGAWLCTVLKTYQENDTSTSIGELKINNQSKDVDIYPNPVYDHKLNINLKEFKASENFEVTITNFLGQIVLQHQIPGNLVTELNLSEFTKNSVYMVSVKSGSFIASKKIIVQ